MCVPSLGWEDPLEEEMATHCSILAWKIPWTEDPAVIYVRENPLDYKEIQPVYSKGDQSWVFIERTDAKAETPIFWLPHGRVDSLEKTLMLGGIGGRRRKGTTEDEMAGWHHPLGGCEFE